MKAGIIELSCFARTVEDIINRFPRNVNPFRDIYRCYDVIEASEILKENCLISTPTLKELTEVTQIFTTEGRIDLLNVLRKLEDIGIMLCPPYIFDVGRLVGEYFAIDTHAIDWGKWQRYSDTISKCFKLLMLDYKKISCKWC